MTEFSQIFVKNPNNLGRCEEKSPSNFEGVSPQGDGVVYIENFWKKTGKCLFIESILINLIVFICKTYLKMNILYKLPRFCCAKSPLLYWNNGTVYKLPRFCCAKSPLQNLKGIFPHPHY